MKAVAIREHGGIDRLVYEDVPTPKLGVSEILVRIHAAAVNHFDHDIREGISRIPHALPHIPGVNGGAKTSHVAAQKSATLGRCDQALETG